MSTELDSNSVFATNKLDDKSCCLSRFNQLTANLKNG